MTDSPMHGDILNAMQRKFITDSSLVEDDPEIRMGELLANASKEILHSATVTGITRFEAAQMYFKKLCQSGRPANQELSSNLATETSHLFRDEEPVEFGPLLLSPNSNIAPEGNSFRSLFP